MTLDEVFRDERPSYMQGFCCGNTRLGKTVAESEFEVVRDYLEELARLDRTYSDTDEDGNEFCYEGEPCHEEPDFFIEMATEACVDACRLDHLSLFLDHYEFPDKLLDYVVGQSLVFDRFELLKWAAEHGFSMNRIEDFTYTQICLNCAFDESSRGQTAEWLASHTGSHVVLLQAVCERVYEVYKGEGLLWHEDDPPAYVVQGRLRVNGWLKVTYHWARRFATATTSHAPGVLDWHSELRGMTAAERALATQDRELISIVCTHAPVVTEGAVS